MWINRVTFFLVSLGLFVCAPLSAQQAVTSSAQSSPQAISLLQKSLAVLVGNTSITDVTLSGTARRIAGSDDETGSVTMKAVILQAARMDFSFASGQRSDVRNFTVNPPAGAWSGPDGVFHAIVYHNLISEPIWFAPLATIAPAISNVTYVSTYRGQETKNSQAVQHITVNRQLPGAIGDTTFFQKLTQFELYLDSSTLLPVAMDFCTHPDTNAGQNIPNEVLFSGYKAVNGMQVPLHVQLFLNNNLVYNLEVQSVSINSGLSATEFQVQ